LGTGVDRSIRITRRSDLEYYELLNAQHTFYAGAKTMRYTGGALYPVGLTDLGDPSNSRSWPNAYIENIFSYNSYTDASNYERGALKWDTNELVIGTEALGTGTDREIEIAGKTLNVNSRNSSLALFKYINTTYWNLTTTKFASVGNLDLGDSSTGRFGTLYGTDGDFSGDVTVSGAINQQTSSAADPTTTEFANDGDWGIHENTTSGNIYLAFNNGGVIV
jgi:hypothetical protein